MQSPVDLTVIVLTFNEEKHIERCLKSAFQVARHVYVVDSYSTDRTRELALAGGALVWEHPFKNYAEQFAWGLDNLPIDTAWVMRVDADEYFDARLADDIRQRLPTAPLDVTGFLVGLHHRFNGTTIRHGGYPLWLFRIWRTGKAHIEQRWMDEHMVIKEGRLERLSGMYIDDNLNNVTWWTTKHNSYATREAIDLLNRKYGFLQEAEISGRLSFQARYKRWLKENLYSRLPPGLRAGFFFFYRMVVRLGILDGAGGFAFHFLQGFWYRFLVDIKVGEVERRMARERIGCIEAIEREFGVKL